MIAKYRKFIAALVGLVALAAFTFFGVGDGQSIFGLGVDQITSVVVGILTALGVWAVPNDPA